MWAELLLLFLVVGMGNYLMRFLPLLLALQRGETEPGEPKDAAGGARGLLTFVGPSVVVALLVTSVLPGNGGELVHTGAALLPTLVVAVRSGNLGLTVLVGVAAYWIVSLIV